MRSRLVPLLCLLFLAGVACRGETDSGKVRVVASIYPLAWIAEEVGGDRVEVIDLTPTGVEAHDVQLTAEQRSEIEDSEVVLMLPVPGFQKAVEDAVEHGDARVVRVFSESLIRGPSESTDPHLWLDPILVRTGVAQVGEVFSDADPSRRAAYERAGAVLRKELDVLSDELRSGFEHCKFTDFVTTHEAFGYLAQAAGLQQIGIEGIAPESEPSAERIDAAIQAIESGEAAPVVFYEETDEGKRIAESVASDAGVPTLPLNTLESEPETGDYISVMRENLANLRKGLQCS